VKNIQRRLFQLPQLFALLAIAWLCRLEACPIPVYQYALEHWPADPYTLEVALAENLSGEELAAWKSLQELQKSEKRDINLEIRTAKTESAQSKPAASSKLRLFYPNRSRNKLPLWEAALNPANVAALLDSPLRQKISKALAMRTSVVWILMLSDNPRQDKKTKRMVEENIEQLRAAIVIPEQADWGGELMNLDFEVEFKLFTVSRKDPAEKVFLSMLLGSEPDLASDYHDEALLFPIFGRGLLLYALVAEGINSWTLSKAVGFLTGSCSCQVKAANPGLDLLLKMPWNDVVEPMTPPSVGGQVGADQFFRAQAAQQELEAEAAKK